MRSRSLLVLAAVVGVLSASAPALAQTPAPNDQGDFAIEYGTFKKANRKAAGALRRSGQMEAVVAEINGRYALPGDIPIIIGDDIEVGPAFIPDLPLEDGTTLSFINVPGDFLTLEVREMRKQLKGVKNITPTEGMVYANEFVLAHEMGHALVDQLKLPITGKEEDAVDGFAAYVLADNPKFGPLTALSAALFFDSMSRLRGELKNEDFADEHSILEQRVYQFLCWTYGSDPKSFKSLIGRDGLPRARAARCGAEWQQLKTSWDALLAPHALPVATPPPPSS